MHARVKKDVAPNVVAREKDGNAQEDASVAVKNRAAINDEFDTRLIVRNYLINRLIISSNPLFS